MQTDVGCVDHPFGDLCLDAKEQQRAVCFDDNPHASPDGGHNDLGQVNLSVGMQVQLGLLDVDELAFSRGVQCDHHRQDLSGP